MKTLSRQKIQPPQLPKQVPAGSLAALEDDGEYAMLALSGCDLSNASVSRPAFEQITFKRAILGPSRYAKPRFLDCRLEASELSAIDWQLARFRRVEFLGCRLIGAQLPDAEFEDVIFKDSNLEGAVFLSARFKAARFENCLLREVSFEGADLAGVVFTGCDLSRADLRRAGLGGADFRGSQLDGVQVGTQELKGAIVTAAQAAQIAALLGLVVLEPGEEPAPS